MAAQVRHIYNRILHSRLPRQVGPLWGAEVVILISSLVQVVVVARVLGPRDYGIAALVMAFPSLLFILFNPQSEEAVVRYLAEFIARDDRQSALAVPRLAYAADLLLAIFGVVVVASLSGWAEHHIVKSAGTAHMMIAYAGGLGLAASAATSRAVLASQNRFSMIAAMNSASAALRICLVLLLVLRGWGVAGVVYGSLLGLAFDALSTAVGAHRTLRRSLEGTWLAARLASLRHRRREILTFMAYTELTTMVTVAFKEGDVVVLGYARGPAEVGLYRFARSCVTPMVSAIVPLQRVLYPQLARLAAQGNTSALGSTLRRQCLLIGVPLGGAILLAVPLLDWAVRALAGSDYGDAVPAAALLMASTAVSMAFFWVRPAYLACGATRPLLVMSTGLSAAALGGFFLFAPIAGATGVAFVRAAVAGFIGSSLLAAYFWFRVRRDGEHPPPIDLLPLNHEAPPT